MFESVKVGGRKNPDVLVLASFKGQKLDKDSTSADKSGAAAEALKRPEAVSDFGQIIEAYPTGKNAPGRILIIGLGEKDSLKAGSFRDLGAALTRHLSKIRADAAEIDLKGPIRIAKLDEGAVGTAFGEGVGLVSWSGEIMKGSATDKPKRPKLQIKGHSKAFDNALERGLGLAEGSNLARTLSQTPPNVATPEYMAAQARKLARATGMTCTVLKGAQLEKEKLTGIKTVGQASENAPCLIRLEYKPSRTGRSAKPIVFVGKTVTYDSGGLSIKVNNGMKGMKRDKDGGCGVLGAMHAIATVIKPNRPVVALLAAAENSISDEAYRPDDVLEFRNGVTVEVTNTDAEGRLVMADALCWACDKENPAAIIDAATLTGGVVVALGSVYAGLWCDDDKLREKIEQAGVTTGEEVWRLPHHDKYRAMMKSPIADVVNSAPVREAHPIQGAAFLSYFVEKGIPWAHIDIAGTHSTDKDAGPYCAGPTGFGARLLAEVVDRF